MSLDKVIDIASSEGVMSYVIEVQWETIDFIGALSAHTAPGMQSILNKFSRSICSYFVQVNERTCISDGPVLLAHGPLKILHHGLVLAFG